MKFTACVTARLTTRLVLAATLMTGAIAGCGNYSNEDLEFMSAIPQHEDLTIEVPDNARMLLPLGVAEGCRTTFQTTRSLNAVADAFLTLIDRIRSNSPPRRAGDERVWGPFPADDNPGWLIQFTMTRTALAIPQVAGVPEPAQFDYNLDMLPAAGGAPISIINGSFAGSGMARTGMGQLHVTLDAAHQAGIVLSGLEKLVVLDILYDTLAWPRSVVMHVENVAPVDPTAEARTADYQYERAENGDGAMTYAWTQDLVPGASGVDTLQIESRWQSNGVGRSDASVQAGDGAGSATVTECWDTTFASTYRLESWAPPATGDESTCLPRL